MARPEDMAGAIKKGKKAEVPEGFREVFYWQAINEALDYEMSRDPTVFVMGEDVAIYGGAYGVTRGLWEKFDCVEKNGKKVPKVELDCTYSERIRDTGISEAAIVGAGIGAAITGMRPVAEIMYVDFMSLVMDQLNNQGAKIRYMFGGKTKVPLVIRTEGGAGRTLGAHHSQSLESWFMHIPGVKLVMPATAYDAKGLLLSAIREDNVVVYIEHKMLYGTKGLIPDVEEYTIPIGRARLEREGADVTVLTYSRQLLFCREAVATLAEEGISCELIDLRTLAPLDMETIAASLAKTNKVAIVGEACKTGGPGAEIVARIVEECFDELDAPPLRVFGADVPMPKSPVLEKDAIPGAQSIAQAVRDLVAQC